MSWVTNVILSIDLTDEVRGNELSQWLCEQAPRRYGTGLGVGALAQTTTWGGWKNPECTVFTGVLNLADVGTDDGGSFTMLREMG